MTLFIGNLSFRAQNEDLREAFAAYGAVVSAHVVLDRETRAPRGFGFVEMSDEREASSAIAKLHDSQLLGRTIVVTQARPRASRFGVER